MDPRTLYSARNPCSWWWLVLGLGTAVALVLAASSRSTVAGPRTTPVTTPGYLMLDGPDSHQAYGPDARPGETVGEYRQRKAAEGAGSISSSPRRSL